ncbi:hypothetical protein [Alistipes putredinis]|uniref:hypothetical protein n=1 Tax=Alistipes putredinis TaxID=28117 RepID=UPI003995A6DC
MTRYIDSATGRFDLERAGLVAYSHGEYFRLGELIGHFGWSVRRRKIIVRERKAVAERRRFRTAAGGHGSIPQRRDHSPHGW